MLEAVAVVVEEGGSGCCCCCDGVMADVPRKRRGDVMGWNANTFGYERIDVKMTTTRPFRDAMVF